MQWTTTKVLSVGFQRETLFMAFSGLIASEGSLALTVTNKKYGD
jgi:hypothetical protein